ncbi:hypothetical protein CPC08DRAFT_720745 [Agrocybe pediades]|nr:hypothetical protein CPC08DRAFT_720745 [Agrocybe pediades]
MDALHDDDLARKKFELKLKSQAGPSNSSKKNVRFYKLSSGCNTVVVHDSTAVIDQVETRPQPKDQEYSLPLRLLYRPYASVDTRRTWRTGGGYETLEPCEVGHDDGTTTPDVIPAFIFCHQEYFQRIPRSVSAIALVHLDNAHSWMSEPKCIQQSIPAVREIDDVDINLLATPQ